MSDDLTDNMMVRDPPAGADAGRPGVRSRWRGATMGGAGTFGNDPHE